jgi:hypothetical protein
MPSISVDGEGNFYAVAIVSDAGKYPDAGNTVVVWKGFFQAGVLAWQPGVAAFPNCQPVHFVSGGHFITDPCFDMPHVGCDPESGTLYLTVTLAESYAYDDYQNSIQITRSVDGGQTWSPLQTLSSTESNGSRVAVGPGGEVYVTWVDFATSEIVGRKSVDNGLSFDPTFVIAPFVSNLASGPPRYSAHPGRQHPTLDYCGLFETAQDFPSLAVDRSGGPRNGTLYVTWAERMTGSLSPGTGQLGEVEPNEWFHEAAPIAIGQTVYGRIEGEPANPPDRDVFSFDAVAGTTLYLRGDMLWTSESYAFPLCSGFNVYSEEDTVYFMARGVMPDVSRAPAMPPVILTLPTTGRYYVLVHTQSYTYDYLLTLRTLSPDAQSVALDHRDIVLVSSGDGGQTWSPKIRVNDDPPLFDDSFPEVVVDNSGDVHVVWYGHRDDPRGLFVDTYWARSLDGTSFLPSLRLSSQSSSWALETNNAWASAGDHLGLAASGDRIHALWMQQGRPDVDIYGVTITPEPVAIAVHGFSASPGPGSIRLEWSIEEAAEFVGFRIHRQAHGSSRVPVGDIPARRDRLDYVFEDRTIREDASYEYTLETLGRSGQSDWYGPIRVIAPPGAFLLSGAYPNPFRGSVQLTLVAPEPATPVAVRIFDVTGRETRSLFVGTLPTGASVFQWDGKDQEGRPAPAGMYLVHANQGGRTTTARIFKVR